MTDSDDRSSHSSGGPERPGGLAPTLDASETTDLNERLIRQVKAPHRPWLVVLTGADVGLRACVDRTLQIGRDPSSDLVLTDGLVSTRHALVEDRGDSWTLVDLGSRNGTLLNGEPCSEGALSPNDKILLGGTVIRFEVQDGVEQAYSEVLEKLLNVDDLSGLLLRRRFDAEVATLLQAAQRRGRPLSLLVMDLDGVKQINDAHGHLFGAYVIGESGRVIGRVVGDRGIATRFGGDEFVVALPGLGMEDAEGVAGEILAAIGVHPFQREGIALHPGISIGVVSFPEAAQDAESLFQLGDEALYRAKKQGKNRVCR